MEDYISLVIAGIMLVGHLIATALKDSIQFIENKSFQYGWGGMKSLLRNEQYKAHISEIDSFQSETEKQIDPFQQRLHGDGLAAFEEPSCGSFTSEPPKEGLATKEVVVKHNNDWARQQSLMRHNTLPRLLGIPSLNTPRNDRDSRYDSVRKRNGGTCDNHLPSPVFNSGAFLLRHLRVWIILGLAAQISLVLSSSTVPKYLIHENSLENANLTSTKLQRFIQNRLSVEEWVSPENHKTKRGEGRKATINGETNGPNNSALEISTSISQTKYIRKADSDGDYRFIMQRNGTDTVDPLENDGLWRQELLNQLDYISQRLKRLTTIFGIEKDYTHTEQPMYATNAVMKSAVGSFPFTNRSQCTVSKDKLTSLKAALDNALSTADGTQNNMTSRRSQCELDPSFNSDNCNELMKLILCSANNLVSGLSQAILNSEGEVAKWQMAYQSLFEKYQQVLDDVSRTESEQFRKKVDALQSELQSIKRSLTQALDKLFQKTMDLCASEIANGKINSAIGNFAELNDDSKLSEIITTVYIKYGGLAQVENILNFSKQFLNCTQQKIAHSALFDVMKTNGHLDSPKVLMFSSAVSLCMPGSPVATELRQHVEGIINEWGYRIRSNNYVQIIATVGIRCNDYSDSYWPEIIGDAYAKNLGNAETILNFIGSLACNNQKFSTLAALLDEMKNNNDLNSNQLMMVAYKIKEEMDLVNPYYKQQYSTLQYKLPKSVIGLIWVGASCTIKNVHYDEYLYAANDRYKYNRDRRRVFTWGPKWLPAQGFWNFKTHNGGRFFAIENIRNANEYLYAANDDFLYDSNRRQIFTWVPGGEDPQGYWKLTPQNDEQFLMWNTAFSEYLFSSWDRKYDHDRRRPFTWRSDSIPDSVKLERLWSINCPFR